MATLDARIGLTLGALGAAGPRPLVPYLKRPAPDLEDASPKELASMIDLLLSDDQNSSISLRFSELLRGWDNQKDAQWCKGTIRNSVDRRALIHRLLDTDTPLRDRIDRALPFYNLDEPLLIAREHEDWYRPEQAGRDYYWRTYREYLRSFSGWPQESLLSLDNHTRAVMECLADPTSKKAYSSRGLAVGFVQSGKTANFIGLAARAADSGYRLIIVLAGTWNILRTQTQRRFDKELLGKELLANDEGYARTPPADWAEFLEHGGNPADRGHFLWQRLTGPDIDFKSLKSSIDNLEFERRNRAGPINDPSNLHVLPAKLLVIKKHSGILHSLVKDLSLLRTKLADLPALVIDDESDQAGLNTVDPTKSISSSEERSETNKRIVELLRLLPRGQYVGYTATPYANAFVDPNDIEDLYPKDFILPLDRPLGYMGISDFFDPESDYQDLNQQDYTLPEIAHVRRVESSPDDDEEDLKLALRSYAISGAIKLYRLARAPERYKSSAFKHHTMLVHTSARKGAMSVVSERLQRLWDTCAFNGPKGRATLEELWRSDHQKVCNASRAELFPRSFNELVPHLAEAIRRIERGPNVFLVVNSDTKEAPDFTAEPVWKIIIGGNKLSRGYTLEGLTVSYYRRVAGTADTLMQMGRWFGFRPGYKDLVRVFLGVKEGKDGSVDLVSLFKDVCRMEERFRSEIKRYLRRQGAPRITPAQVPALVAVCGRIPPSARNKMFNAVMREKNFGGQTSMLTLAPTTKASIDSNLKTFGQLLKAPPGEVHTLGGTAKAGKSFEFKGVVWSVRMGQIESFLRDYIWLESDYPAGTRPTDVSLQLEFLEKQDHGIRSWLVIAPQRSESFGSSLAVSGTGEVTVKKRSREEKNRGFQVFGEPDHRLVARYLTKAASADDKDYLKTPNRDTSSLLAPNTGVVVVYPVREIVKGPISIGFEVFFPPNDLPFDCHFTVQKKSQSSAIVVSRRP